MVRMAVRVLLVEDDRSVREIATLVLEQAGFAVTAVADGPAAVHESLQPCAHDLVVLDLMLPGMDGLDVCRTIRHQSNIPIVILTAKSDATDVVAGLECGADDYVTKPFEPSVLAARVRAVLRRTTDEVRGADVWGERDLVIDERAFEARRGDEVLPLTSIELRLLIELLRDAGAVLTRTALLERVWGYDYLGDSRLVDMAIKRLRDKLGEPDSPPPYISTVRGVGYRFERQT
jgi:two-component system response regulator MtrA